MATVTTYQSSTPHSLVVSAVGDGAVDAQARAAVLAACAEGPLKAVLAKVGNWALLNLGSALCGVVEVRAIVNRAGGVTSGEAQAFRFFWTAAGFNVAATRTGQFEIRLQHSERR